MISRQHQFLFVHVPKTGGNSIQDILIDYSEDKIVKTKDGQDGKERFEVRHQDYRLTKHSTLYHYRRELEPELFSSLFKVATIRNPWDMAISYYFSPHRGPVQWDRDDFKAFVTKIPPIRHYIYAYSFIEKAATKLGLPFFKKSLTRDIDLLIRFEHLQEDFDTFCNKVNLPQTDLPHRNKSKKKHYSQYYDPELINIVQRHFQEDIQLGNYRFETG